ncbi:MAG: AMP-binding protein [Acidimicrobiales bacterium]
MTLLEPGRRAARLGMGLAEHGARLALAAPGRQLTYTDLSDLVDDVAGRLGTAPRLVLAPLDATVDSVVGYLAALAAGHPVLVSEDDPERMAALVDRFDPDVVLRSTGAGVELDERRALTSHALHPDLALLLPTSGSTGAPRHVRLSQANLLANATAIAEYLAITSDDRAITSLPLHYCYGLSVLHSHLVQGAGVVLTDRSVVDTCFWNELREHEVTNLAGVPYTFEMLDRVGFSEMHLPSLRFITQAGGRLAPEHVRRLAQQGARDGWDFVVMYGQTEATARMAYLPPWLAATHPSAIGIPIPGGSFRLDRSGDATAAGDDTDLGELVYSGPNVMLGYADQPSDLAVGATVDELHTGDLARVTAEGLYEIVGRRSRFAKVCGLRVDLEQLEARLRGERIDALCASDDRRVAVAVTDRRHAPIADDLVRRITGLPASRVDVVMCDPLPRLPNGKPDHQQVLRLVPAPDVPPEPPAGSDAVRTVFQRVLGVDTVADTDTFVSLGGDSLSYVEASIALEALRGDLPPDWPNVPVAQLAAAGRPSSRFAHIETSVVLRAIGIVLVVGMHIKLWHVLGGAHLLLVMAGVSYGRFQGTTEGRLRSIARIAVPSVIWLAIATQTNPRIRYEHVLQVNGWFGGETAHGGYWFVEALLQILIPLTLLLAIPAVGRVERARPLQFASTALAVGLLVRFHVIDLPVVEPHDIRPHDIFWMFAIGWTAAHVRSIGPRVALSLVVIVGLPGYFGEPQREALLVVGLLLLLWVPTLAVPRVLTKPIGLVAGASLYIYLCHWQVFPLLRSSAGQVVALLASLVAGVLLWQLARRTELIARRRFAARSRRQGQPEPSYATAGPPR